MIEGFWIVQYEGMQGNGGGVAVLLKGKIFGGDTGYIYTGSYEMKGDQLTARVAVKNFLPGIPSVLGVVGDFELNIEGKLAGDVIKGTGSLVDGRAVGIGVKLTKRAELPA
jgi:T3SS negative regulator,GrlR